MPRRLTVEEYLRGPETLRPSELVYGFVREPPSPRYSHQSVVTQITVVLHEHVRSRNLGRVCVSPIDVVLDRERALVVQPDIIFVATARLDIIRDQVWGAPDLVIEVLSRRTAARDRTVKLGWYRRYGVRECWLVDAARRQIEVVDCEGSQEAVFHTDEPLRSRVLPDLAVRASDFFEE